MAERTVFEKLADTLPEKERKDLLEKIGRSMSFGDTGDENIYEKQMTNDEREVLISQDLERLSILGRFWLWFRSAISGKSRRDLLVSSKLRALKGTINHKFPGLTGFETRDITPKFADAVFDLYKLTMPLAPLYRRLVIRSREIEGAFVELLEKRYPETRIVLSDIISAEELERVYDEKGQEQAVRRAAMAKFDEFAASLDETVFDAVESSIVPVFYLKDIVFFPYASLFELFHLSISSMLPDQEPVFRSASAMLAIEHLEKLYFALYNVSKIPTPIHLEGDVAEYLLALEEGTDESGGAGGASSATEEEAEDKNLAYGVGVGEEGAEETSEAERRGDMIFEEAGASAETLAHEFVALFEAAQRFDKRMPIVELIRYFLKDPYHRMYVYVPRLRLRDYYQAVAKVRLLAQIEEIVPMLRVRVVDNKIDRLFKGQRLTLFHHYREYKSVDYEKMGLPFFSRTRSLNLLFNFIRWYYREYVQELVKILGTVILVQNRVTRNKLLQHATTVEDLEQKIWEFDASLSPDTEEGKVFHRLRASLGGDPGHQRMFRTIVLQKDVQVNGFVERGRESFAGLQKVFEEVYMTPSEAVRERLSSRFYLNGRLQPLSKLLKERAAYIREFLSILLQVMRLEGV